MIEDENNKTRRHERKLGKGPRFTIFSNGKSWFIISMGIRGVYIVNITHGPSQENSLIKI